MAWEGLSSAQFKMLRLISRGKGPKLQGMAHFRLAKNGDMAERSYLALEGFVSVVILPHSPCGVAASMCPHGSIPIPGCGSIGSCPVAQLAAAPRTGVGSVQPIGLTLPRH